MINNKDLISIGIIRRTHDKTLPPFVFVKRDGLFVPFKSEDISELKGEEGFVLRTDLLGDEENSSLLTWQDIVGFSIVDEEVGTIGVIESIDESTINTLATLTDGRMIPLHEDFITDIDEEAQTIHVNLPFQL